MRSNNLPVSFIVSSSILELGTGHRFSGKVLDGFHFFLTISDVTHQYKAVKTEKTQTLINIGRVVLNRIQGKKN